MAEAEAAADTTLDAFYGGRLTLRQPRQGHRSGTDAVLLAASVPRAFDGLLVDAGAGVGAAGLGVALACPGARVLLLENDAATVTLASREHRFQRSGRAVFASWPAICSTEPRAAPCRRRPTSS